MKNRPGRKKSRRKAQKVEDDMGKWATYQKRGGSDQFGALPAPGPSGGDWTIGAPTTTTIPFTRVAVIPSGATQMLARAINNATGAIASAFSGSPISSLTTGTTYRVQTAWFNGAVQVSEASPSTLVTTA
jgi:hypothetical protein